MCQLSGTDKDQPARVTGFVNSIEGKLEYRFPMLAPDQLSLRAGREPAAERAAVPGSTGNIRGFVATPAAVGLLFRSCVASDPTRVLLIANPASRRVVLA